MRYYDALNLPQLYIPNASVKMATLQQKARLWFHESNSIATVQRCVRIEYRDRQSPIKNFIKPQFEQFNSLNPARVRIQVLQNLEYIFIHEIRMKSSLSLHKFQED
ncbi:hypothetical protein AVEN_148091-1 [Araneus ventricosus]|uniref:DUF4817 domain-containing protein n=1 Tax=Araneus ventricosus TaxID=182803 RepID=A0A4Y2G5P5_ARAVE|nr:hypothetical protein AVEN_148091-1 [Araneus ventricosus]